MATKNSKSKHVFGRARPSRDGNVSMHVRTSQEKRDTHYRPLPDPTGKEPFHLDLKDILPADDYDAIKKSKKLVFHVNGDMGGINYDVPQKLVAQGMESDFDLNAHAAENPAFLYILGDCVYYNGEKEKYYAQYYQPYEHYMAPIFAVPGNHDGENLPGENSLEGFLRNFCADHPHKTEESGDSSRTAMIQPNVYWTLRTPFVNIVGLYSNVPEGGDIRSPQTEWLTDQLKSLPKDVPLFVTLHHPVYSADIYHSGSTVMKETIEAAAEAANRHPDMVLAGHVHDYQRITKHMQDGQNVPYLVAGAGGYSHLHAIVKVDGEAMVTPTTIEDKEGESVTLEKYCADRWGFLRLEVAGNLITGRYYVVPRPQEPYSKGSQLFDYFEYDWKKRQYLPNKLKSK